MNGSAILWNLLWCFVLTQGFDISSRNETDVVTLQTLVEEMNATGGATSKVFPRQQVLADRNLQNKGFIRLGTIPNTIFAGDNMTLVVEFERQGGGDTRINTNWRDGSTDATVAPGNEGSIGIWHIYEQPGAYTVTVTVQQLGSTKKDIVVSPRGTTPAPTPIITDMPTSPPTKSPTRAPTKNPTRTPSSSPSRVPTTNPTSTPSSSPSNSPTSTPVASPSSSPTITPTLSPTSSPTDFPSRETTQVPPVQDSAIPTMASQTPTSKPSNLPSLSPSSKPSQLPTLGPSNGPTLTPTRSVVVPTLAPSKAPTVLPSFLPSGSPTSRPSMIPTIRPSIPPTTLFVEFTDPGDPQPSPPIVACPVVSMFPFTSQKGNNLLQHRGDLGLVGYMYTAATQLAMDHFNQRNPSVVPALADLNCDVVFTDHVVLDSEMNENTLFEKLFHTLDSDSPPCALFGPALLTEMKSIGPFSFAMEMPQISYLSDYQTTNEDPFLITGIVPVVEQEVESLLAYLKRPTVARELLVVMYSASEESKLFTETVQRLSIASGLQVVLFDAGSLPLPSSIPNGEDPELFLRKWGLEKYIERIQVSGIQTMLLDLNPRDMYIVAELLQARGMLSSDYFYVLNERNVGLSGINSTFSDRTNTGALVNLLDGALIISKIDRSMIMGASDPFLSAWKAQGNAFKNRVDEILPRSQSDNSAVFSVPDDFFSTYTPVDFASFVYDAVMMLGLSKCAAKSLESDDLKSRYLEQTGVMDTTTRVGSNVSSSDLVRSMKNLSFEGATGVISISDTGGRGGGYLMGAFNVRADVNNIRAVLTSSFLVGDMNAAASPSGLNLTIGPGWNDVSGEKFRFRGGSEEAPVTNRIITDANYLSRSIRIFGLVLMALGWVLSGLCILLSYVLRKDRSVRASQPAFMITICVGSIILNATIFTLSWDEGAGWSDQQLDFACSLSPWFFFVGHIITFLAIFTKLYRLDRVMQFRRARVRAYQVLGPLLLFLFVTVALLIVWTVQDPWHWQRTLISIEPPITYGKCESDSWWQFFGPLMGLIVLAEGLTFYIAYKTNSVPEEFRETAPVIQSIYVHLQGWAMGVPILAVIGTNSADATYLGHVALIWMFGVSSVLILVAPKIYLALRLRRDPLSQRSANRGNIFVSGISNVNGTSLSKTVISNHSNMNDSDVVKSSTNEASLPDRYSGNGVSQAEIVEDSAPVRRSRNVRGPDASAAAAGISTNSSHQGVPSISYLKFDNVDDDEA